MEQYHGIIMVYYVFFCLTWIYIYIYNSYVIGIIYIYMGKLERPDYDLTRMMISKGNYPKMALFQVSEIL